MKGSRVKGELQVCYGSLLSGVWSHDEQSPVFSLNE